MSNGSELKYPYPLVVHSLQRLCDDVIVGVDPNYSLDRKTIESFCLEGAGLQIVDAPWDRENRHGGTEIALQMDRLVNLAELQGSDWVVVMQADELFHDEDFEMLRAFMDRNIDTNVTGLSTERTYFWRNLSTIRSDWCADLVRVFKPGMYSFLAESTSKDGMYSGPTSPGVEIKLPYKIYHYSRVDPDPMVISKRVRNLDTFFHEESTLIEVGDLPVYDFTTRTHDNFSKGTPPKEVDVNVRGFVGTHPLGVEEWYCG